MLLTGYMGTWIDGGEGRGGGMSSHVRPVARKIHNSELYSGQFERFRLHFQKKAFKQKKSPLSKQYNNFSYKLKPKKIMNYPDRISYYG